MMRKKNSKCRNLQQVKAWNAAHRSRMRASSAPVTAYARLMIFKRKMEARDTPEGHLMTAILSNPRLRMEILECLENRDSRHLAGSHC